MSIYRNVRLSDFIFCGELELCLSVSEHSDRKVLYQGLDHSFHVNDRNLSHRCHLVRIKKV